MVAKVSRDSHNDTFFYLIQNGQYPNIIYKLKKAKLSKCKLDRNKIKQMAWVPSKKLGMDFISISDLR